MIGPSISPEALKQCGRDVVLLDARVGSEAGLPVLAGAQRVDLEIDLSRPRDATEGGRHPLPSLDAWCGALGRWGIGPHTDVVVYDNRGGGLAAARTWWMLRAVGHASVAILDGGLQGAIAAGFPTTTKRLRSVGGASYPAHRWTWQTVDAGDVEARLGDPAWRILDARSEARFLGIHEPLDPVAGAIPGAVNLPWESCLDKTGRLVDRTQLAKLVDEALGGIPSERTICSCGSGVTACHTLFVLEVLGRAPAKLYVGSWSEWCRQRRPWRPRGLTPPSG